MAEDRLRPDERQFERLAYFAGLTFSEICGWLYSRDWWMHHRDAAHTGAVRSSGIRRTTVGRLIQRCKVELSGPIVSMPCVVNGKIFVGTSTRRGSSGGALYKIDLKEGRKETCFRFTGVGDRRAPHGGVASSPAVTGGRVYFSALTGMIYCLDAASLACLWVTNLRHADSFHNQPVDHGSVRANCWSSPLVVNNRVYVTCGEGESTDDLTPATFGFVYCLNAKTGEVIWLYCTNCFACDAENSPNVIPPAVFAGSPSALFKKADDNPRHRGASPWSPPAYSARFNRIYVGTGNAVEDNPLPDPRYASGLLSLDATTGEYKGFFQPNASDNYRPDHDVDVDVPAGPLLFSREDKEYVCVGCKGGSFFILDADTMKIVARRQLLPRHKGGQPFDEVDPSARSGESENKSGIFGTAALASHFGSIFVGLGGYKNVLIDDHPIHSGTTPFVRALNWGDLTDAWPTRGDDPPRYSAAQPPLYSTDDEAGMSSPAVVNDVVFVSTTRPALYAFDAETGLCLWMAPGIPAVPGTHAFGPAVYGNFVVNGLSDGNLYIYSL